MGEPHLAPQLVAPRVVRARHGRRARRVCGRGAAARCGNCGRLNDSFTFPFLFATCSASFSPFFSVIKTLWFSVRVLWLLAFPSCPVSSWFASRRTSSQESSEHFAGPHSARTARDSWTANACHHLINGSQMVRAKMHSSITRRLSVASLICPVLASQTTVNLVRSIQRALTPRKHRHTDGCAPLLQPRGWRTCCSSRSRRSLGVISLCRCC